MKNGWQTRKLGDACRFIDYRGRTPDKTESGLRLITAKNVKMGFLQREPLEYVNPKTYEGWMTRGIPKKGDILFTTEAPLANVTQLDTDEKVVFAQRIIILQPHDSALDRTFLKYLLLSDDAQERIRQNGTGATVQGIKASLLKQIEISFPTPAEQQRIVGVLDEAFAGLATAQANAEKNLQNARALFESHLQSVFTQRGKGWQSKSFEDCIEDVQYTTKVQRKDFLEEGKFPIVSQEAEFTNGYWNKAADVFKVTRPVIIFGDHTKILKFVDFDFVLGADGVKILPPKQFLIPKFFFYQLRSAPLKALGYARHYRLLKELEISYPDSDEQTAIVKKLDSLSTETQRLESLYEQKLAALAALKKSLLHQAFSGEL